MGIDVGGLAQFYRDTVWVNQDGSYLRPGEPAASEPTAFAEFPGLEEIFAEGKLAVWKGAQGRQFLWVPMFATEEGRPLWVGRGVDPSPIDDFRNALILRVLSIILILVAVVMVLARWIAARAEHFGQELTGGIGQILRDGKPLRFRWRGPREVRELGEQLTALAETHADHLRAAREHTRELERSNRFKSEFLANVSHELRTPLNSILLLSKMLGADTSGLTPDQRRQARVIHEAGADLRALIDNILDISRIEAGHVDVSLEWVELAPMLTELTELVRPLIDDKRSDWPSPWTPRPRTGSTPTATSCARSSRTSSPTRSSSPMPARSPWGSSRAVTRTVPCALSVTDTGIGIPPEKQDIIFEAFQQADGSTRRRYGGTGLGLSISRELANLLGGRIEVRSQPGAGSRFELRLPLSLQDGVPAALQAPPPAQQGLEPAQTQDLETEATAPTMPPDPDHWVLILDRDVKSLVRLTELIGLEGLSVQTAADLDEALETLQEDPRGCLLVLVAAHASQDDTCDTIGALMQYNRDHGTAVVVLGDEQTRSQLRACRAAGALDLIAKPVAPCDLRDLLHGLPRRGSSPRERHETVLAEAEPPVHTP